MFDITGRVQELRNEILALKQEHEVQKYSTGPTAVVEKQHRELRLKQIQVELRGLMDRLKTQRG